ncbi:hypothetical protein FKM82_011755 [Ascaphus truei]
MWPSFTMTPVKAEPTVTWCTVPSLRTAFCDHRRERSCSLLQLDPPPHPLSTGDHLPPATTPVSTSPVGASSLSGDDFREEPDSSHAGSMPPPKNQPPSDLPSPAHLDSSKQHFNETKGHSGRNQTSDGEGVGMGSASVGSWLLPVLLGSSVTFLCCCSGLLAFGCCKRRRGRYRPGREGNTGRRKLIMCTLLKEKV